MALDYIDIFPRQLIRLIEKKVNTQKNENKILGKKVREENS